MDERDIKAKMAVVGYVVDDTLAVALHLAMTLKRPLLLEGAAGVGKTDVARALADMLETRLIRLQCYEGLDANTAIYEWNYQRQLLAIKAHEKSEMDADELESHVFSDKYLLKRPLLEAISENMAPILLIDEIDRADTEFEAYLLEVLADYQITVPELGTIKATTIPHVILTSNGTRDLSDALRRRCLYSYLDYPDMDKELAIIRARMPQIDGKIAKQITAFVQSLRKEDLEKIPGIAETLDWAAALSGLNIDQFDGDIAKLHSTLICLLKTEADLNSVTLEVTSRLAGKAA